MEKYERKNIDIDINSDLVFQALEWSDFNEQSEDLNSEDSDSDSEMEYYKIRIFGVTKKGESVCLTVNGMSCYFYIKLEDTRYKEEILNYINFRLGDKYPNSLIKKECEIVKKKDYYGFYYDKEKREQKLFTFLKLSFNNSLAMKMCSNIFSNRVKIQRISEEEKSYPCYESNVDPMIRFIHTQELQTSGWIKCLKGTYTQTDYSTCQINVETNYKMVKQPENSEELGTSPFIQASFDIEAYSQYILESKVNCKKNSNIVKSKKSRFTKELVKGISLTFGTEYNQETKIIKNIISDTELEVDTPFKSDYKKVKPIINKDKKAEKGMNDKRPFPNPETLSNYVTQIGTSFKRYLDDDFYLKHIITLKECEEIKGENVIVESYKTEKELLLAWIKLFIRTDPDIIYTYNGDKFDWWYLYKRAKELGIEDKFEMGFSRLQDYNCEMKKEKFSSGAYGTSFYNRFKIPGRINFDILIYIQREFKLKNYKLDFVAEKYLNQKKNEVSPQQIFDFFRIGSPDKIKIIAEYCIQDTVLPQKLIDKLCILPNQIEMANVTYVPIRYLIERGQQIKVFSQIIKETAKKGYLIPNLKVPYWSKYRNYEEGDIITYNLSETNETYQFYVEKGNKGQEPMIKSRKGFIVNKKYYSEFNNEKFQGATVLEPKTGAYLDTPISVLDFASLYPNIIREHNLDYATFVLRDSNGKYIDGDISDIDYYTVGWKDKKGQEIEYKFVKDSKISVIPNILSDLIISRKKAKKSMENETDPFKKALFNGKQLALKVSCNSVYGFFAAQMLQCKPIAASVTTIGRMMIENTKNYAEKEFKEYVIKNKIVEGEIDITVIYGDTDSIFVKFDTGKRGTEAIKDSFKLGQLCADLATKKLFKPPSELEREKDFMPLLLYEKKRYAGAKYEKNPEKPDYIDFKGIELTRRDNAQIVKDIYQGCLNKVMYEGEREIKNIIKYVRDEINKLMRNEVTMDKLTISKSLRADYKIRTKEIQKNTMKNYQETNSDSDSDIEKQLPNIAHVKLAEKMRRRDPGTAPVSGERMDIVYVEDEKYPTNKKKQKSITERCEDPNYVLENKLKIDKLYYLNNQLRKPLTQFLRLFTTEEEVNGIFDKIEMEYIKKRTGQQNITNFFKKA